MSIAPRDDELPRLETERLILRQLTRDDTDALFRHFSDDVVTRFMDIDSLNDPAEAAEIVAFCHDLWRQRQGCRWAIVRKVDKTLIGTCGFNTWVRQRGSRGEIGYDLSPLAWGQGLMPEALRVAITFGFRQMHLHRIEAFVDPANARSVRVLEKLGFQCDGLLRDYGFWKGRFWNEACYSQLAPEWQI